MRGSAQFWVAVIGAGGIVGTSLLAMSGLLFGNSDNADIIKDITFMLVGGLISIASAATGWLFRNGNGVKK